jgi:hypothetical protein
MKHAETNRRIRYKNGNNGRPGMRKSGMNFKSNYANSGRTAISAIIHFEVPRFCLLAAHQNIGLSGFVLHVGHAEGTDILAGIMPASPEVPDPPTSDRGRGMVWRRADPLAKGSAARSRPLCPYCKTSTAFVLYKSCNDHVFPQPISTV